MFAVMMRMLLPEPGAARVSRVNVPEIPVGSPVTEKTTAASKPPLTVAVRITLLLNPAVTGREVEEAATWIEGVDAASLQWLTKTEASMEPRPVA